MSARLIVVWMAVLLTGTLQRMTGSSKPRRQSAGPDRPPFAARAERSGSVNAKQQGGDSGGNPDEIGPRSAAEWTVLAVSAAVVALLIGAALYEHYAQEEPPGIRIVVSLALDQADVRDGLTYVPFTIRNTGRAPAEHVVVRFEIKLGDETIEESTADVAFLPNSGSAEGEVVTALDLSTHTIEARVATVQVP